MSRAHSSQADYYCNDSVKSFLPPASITICLPRNVKFTQRHSDKSNLIKRQVSVSNVMPGANDPYPHNNVSFTAHTNAVYVGHEALVSGISQVISWLELQIAGTAGFTRGI